MGITKALLGIILLHFDGDQGIDLPAYIQGRCSATDSWPSQNNFNLEKMLFIDDIVLEHYILLENSGLSAHVCVNALFYH